MFTTAFAIILGSIGAGTGFASLLACLLTFRKQRLFEERMFHESLSVAEFLQRKIETNSAQVFRAAESQSAQMVAEGVNEVNGTVAVLINRLDGLEFATAEELITRAEVSAAFAELAAIEEQRQRQSMRDPGTVNAMPVNRFGPFLTGAQVEIAPSAFSTEAVPGQADPWKTSDQVNAAPADPAALLKEIAAMNQRLQGRLSAMGGAS
jgi:hypothetical protein